MFEKIKRWFEKGLWTQAMVHSAVEKGVITSKEYKTITGKKYTA